MPPAPSRGLPAAVRPPPPALRLPSAASRGPGRGALGRGGPQPLSGLRPARAAALHARGAPCPRPAGRPPFLHSLHFPSASSFKPRRSASARRAASSFSASRGLDRPPDFLLLLPTPGPPRAPSPARRTLTPFPMVAVVCARRRVLSLGNETEKKRELPAELARPGEPRGGSEGCRGAGAREDGRRLGPKPPLLLPPPPGCYQCHCHVSASSRRCSAPQTPPQLEPPPPPRFLKYATCVLAPPTPRHVTVAGAT